MINQVSFPDAKDVWARALSQNPIQIPFLTWEWHNDWFQTLGASYTPLTFIIGNEVAASFARKGDGLIFAGGDEIADYLDIVGDDSKKQSAWGEIIQQSAALGVQEILLRNVPENSATKTYFSNMQGAECTQEDTTPQFLLPNSWEDYLNSLSKKYRHELERKIRKFNREHPDSEIIESTNPADDISILFDLMEKDDAKKIFLTAEMKEFFLRIANTFSSHTSLRYIRLGDKKIAATLSFVMNNSHYLYNSGFDKDCCSIAGFFLKAMNIQHAISHHARSYNFLQGNERYKYELAGQDFGVYKIQVKGM